MPVIILYLLKLSVSLVFVWGFYHFLLRKLTFYRLNRWYLLGYSLFSFFIPFINIGPIFDSGERAQPVVNYIPVIWDYQTAAEVRMPLLSVWDIVLIAVGLGSLFLAGRFMIRWIALRKLRGKAHLISDAEMKIYQIDQSITPFSFGNSIFINGKQHTQEELDAIIQHEFVHVRQRHTVDILLAEFFCMLNWFNPVVWLIRRDIRQNLEFIADQAVVSGGCDRKLYQYHLLKVAGHSRYYLTNNFNFSSLKKRIIMMNKVKSARLHLVKFLFMLPLVTVLLMAFRSVPAEAGGAGVKAAPMAEAILMPMKNATPDVRDTLRKDTSRMKRIYVAPRVVPNKDTVPDKNKAVQTVRITGFAVDKPKPLILVDGKPLPPDADLNSINPDDISSMQVLKGEGATSIFGPAGLNGVVAIITKKGQAALPPKDPNKEVVVQGRPGPAVIIRDSTAVLMLNVKYYVDGVEKTKEELNLIKPADIESINVLKGTSAVAKYGEGAKNGAVEVLLKKK